MAEFTVEVFQNEFLADGATDVHAVVRTTCKGSGSAGRSGTGDAAEIIIIDTSGSMGYGKIAEARRAADVAVDQILDGTWFAVIAGTEVATRAFPFPNAEMSIVRMEPGARAAAKTAISMMEANGGTAIGSWLRLAGQLFDEAPSATQRHAILLTDGQNQHESRSELEAAVGAVRGRFQCDCRGVGSDWEVAELRLVSTELLGSLELLREPGQLAADFEALMRAAMDRGVADVELRVWAPQGAQVLFVKQVSPTLEDLTSRRTQVNPLTGSYPTGAWKDETRDYQIAVRLSAKPVGAEQLAARLQLAVGSQVVANALIKAMWSDDEQLTTRINPEVAHYTGQAELAQVIQEGLAAKAAGDGETATQKLGRAVQLATESGNDEVTAKLRKVVEIEDADTGTVRLRREVDKLDEMDLDVSSTKTTRVRR
jgi:hypothetical protein